MRRILKFLFFPLLCLFGVSSVTAYSIYKSSSRHALQRPSTTPVPLNEQMREIASIEPSAIDTITAPLDLVFQKEEIIKQKVHTTLSHNCEATVDSLVVSSDHVMIKFKNCERNLKAASSKLVNTTNGYAAQLFKVKERELSTDFIQLKKGENILKFEISLNDGQKKTQTIKINRIQ